MQRRSNINLNSAGKISSFLLLLITFLAISPISSSTTYAEESGDDSSVATDDKTRTEPVDEDYAISTHATTTPSSVTLSFDKTAAESSVTPINSTAMPVYADVIATVTIADSGGYSVYVGSTSLDNNLTNGEHIITPISDTDCNSGVCDLASIPVGKWGYSFRTITNPQNEEADHTSYEAVPLNLRTNAKDSGGVTKAQIEKKYALSFAANVDSTIASGTYTGSVTMSVVSSPLEVTDLTSITDMQEMSNPICEATSVGTSKQLQDTRDNKFYWVTKMADGKCWMTQNLDLDIGTVSSASDVAPGSASWPDASKSDYTTAPNIAITNTAGYAGSKTVGTDTPLTRSWSLGDYRMTSSEHMLTNGSGCGYPKHLLSECTDNNNRFMAYATPTSANGDENAHYIVGNHYQWVVAAAGTTDGSASICPKNWRLPISGEGGELQVLSNTLGATIGTATSGTVSKLTKKSAEPGKSFYAVRSGYVHQSTTYLFHVAGDYGYYWSSTPASVNIYYLRFNTSTTILPSDNDYQYGGLPVRCIAR